jgi:predicted MFS family arabinose efflux permease
VRCFQSERHASVSTVPEVKVWPALYPTRDNEAPHNGISAVQVAIFAAACGLTVANIFYTQPLIGLIGPALGLHAGLAGLIVTLTQLGYGAGLLLLVPLSDVLENRRLVIWALCAVVLGLLGIAVSNSAATFMASSFVVGVFAAATQILVPFASHLAPEASRGKVVGNVMSGLLGGIMLARPFSSYVASTLGWRAVFYISAGMMLTLILLLLRALPQRRPSAKLAYPQILRSLPSIVASTPTLRRRAFYQAMMFAGFNVFWIGTPLFLAHEFGFSQRGIALFTLAGAAGALAAPIAGRLADRGLTRPATGAALVAAVAAFVLAIAGGRLHSLAFLILAALLLDAAVQMCQVLSLRSIYTLAPALRGRLNGLFVAFAFLGGATGSGAAPAVYALRGWTAVGVLGTLFVVAALAYYSTEVRKSRP